jgi:PAS domain S-box-containing protein
MSIDPQLSQLFCHASDNLPQALALLSIGAVIATYEGKILYANQQGANLLGYTPKELINLNLDSVSHPHDLLHEKVQRQRCWRGEQASYRVEKRFRHRQGQIVWLQIDATILKDGENCPAYILMYWQDITERKHAEAAFVANEKRFRQIFEEVPVGMAIIGFNHRLIKVNKALCDMTGYSEAELLSRPFDILTHPEDHLQDTILAKQLYYGRIPHYQLEKRCITKSQNIIWVLLTAYIIRNEQGKAVNSLAMIRDITKQKTAQEYLANALQEKELFLKEIHHRVKNNLHVIANLLELQSQSIEDESLHNLFSDSQNRIYTMALIHEHLYQSSHFGKVELGEYIKNLTYNLLAYYDQEDINLQLQLDKIWVNMETAIPCGLVVNELVTNALKYAWANSHFPGVKQLTIMCVQSDDRLITLTIKDNGLGLGATGNSHTLGMRLVKLLAKQLDATLHTDTQAGTSFQLTFSELQYHDRFQTAGN